jgi:hypothetical protein
VHAQDVDECARPAGERKATDENGGTAGDVRDGLGGVGVVGCGHEEFWFSSRTARPWSRPMQIAATPQRSPSARMAVAQSSTVITHPICLGGLVFDRRYGPVFKRRRHGGFMGLGVALPVSPLSDVTRSRVTLVWVILVMKKICWTRDGDHSMVSGARAVRCRPTTSEE